MYRAGLLLILLAAACATIDDHQRVEDWPRLTKREHYVPHHVMRDRCVKYTTVGQSPEACAEVNFAARRCDMWFSADFPPQVWIVRHERLHCDGFDHAGDTTLRDALARYREAGGR